MTGENKLEDLDFDGRMITDAPDHYRAGTLVGYGLYHETLTFKKIAGIVICLGGLVLINM